MKALALAHSFPRTPADPVGSFVLRLAVALGDQGIETRVIAPMAPGLARRERLEGIEVRRFRYAPSRYESLAYTGTMRQQVGSSLGGRLALAAFVAAEYLSGLRVGREFRPDVVHAHWVLPSGLVGLWLSGGWRVPLVTTSHGTDVRLARGNRVAGRLFAEVVRGADAVTTVSSWLAREAAALAPEVAPEVAPMPVLPDLFRPGPGPRATDRLLFVGKLNEQKGIAPLLEALARMRARPTLEIVMGVGSVREPTEALARSLGVADRLVWFPLLSQSELVSRYQQATALVAPFVGEGLGLVPVEAQLCETPVVGFASGGLMDVVRAGRTGLLVAPGNVAGLAAALDDLLARPDRGAAWGREGRRHALEAFSPEGAARRYAEIYRRVTAIHA